MADKRTLIIIAVCFGLLLMLDANFSLSEKKPKIAEFQIAELGVFEKEANVITARVDSAQKLFFENPFLENINKEKRWTEKLENYKKRIEEDRKLASELKELAGDKNKGGFVAEKLSKLNADKKDAMQNVQGIHSEIDRFIEYHKNPSALIKISQENNNFIQTYDFTSLNHKVQKAGIDWPQISEDLASKFSLFAGIPQKSRETFSSIEKLKDPSENWERLGLLSSSLNEDKEMLTSSAGNLSLLIDQLYYSRDKIIEDMETANGKYYHKYKTVIINPDNSVKEESIMEEVSPALYEQHRNNIGMTVETKPKGLYEYETQKTTIPPGYSYVGDERYGRWERSSSGTSFWAFYGQYRFLESLFWGSYYSPITYRNYNDFSSMRNTGKTYYGSGDKKTYGSEGVFTSKKYSGSKYMKSGGGFASSQYNSQATRRTYSSGESFTARRGGSRVSRGGGFFGGK